MSRYRNRGVNVIVVVDERGTVHRIEPGDLFTFTFTPEEERVLLQSQNVELAKPAKKKVKHVDDPAD